MYKFSGKTNNNNSNGNNKIDNTSNNSNSNNTSNNNKIDNTSNNKIDNNGNNNKDITEDYSNKNYTKEDYDREEKEAKEISKKITKTMIPEYEKINAAIQNAKEQMNQNEKTIIEDFEYELSIKYKTKSNYLNKRIERLTKTLCNSIIYPKIKEEIFNIINNFKTEISL